MRKTPGVRKTFAALDDALIERVFQPLSELIANQLRIQNAKAACICVDAASLAWIVSRGWGLAGAAWDSATAVLDVALLLLGLAALISLRSLFRRTAKGKQANPLRQTMQPHRAIILLMLAARLTQLTPFGLTEAADLAMLLCAAAALYFGACVERPPVRRRHHELIATPIRG